MYSKVISAKLTMEHSNIPKTLPPKQHTPSSSITRSQSQMGNQGRGEQIEPIRGPRVSI